MQRDLVAVPENMTVGQVIDYLREHNDLTTDFWEIFVVDEQHTPIGTCQLSWVLRCPRGIPLSDVTKREQTLIPVDMDEWEVRNGRAASRERLCKYGKIPEVAGTEK